MKILHKGQIEISGATVTALLLEQFPQYADLPLREYTATGTVNAIFRLGDSYYIRLPILKTFEAGLLKEYALLPYLSKHISIPIPKPMHLGRPNTIYPSHWAIYTWIDGDTAGADSSPAIVSALAGFINELHSLKIPETAPKAGRKPLADLNAVTLSALEESKNEISYKRTVSLWERLRETPAWDNKPVWIHGDLLKPNILIKADRLAGIVDFGSAGIGDPAFDIIPAWTIFDSDRRRLFQEAVNVCPAVWNRACAYALHQAALIIPYYRKTNKPFAEQAIQTIREILLDYPEP
ncbi:MAG: aminoglycoside phosphotransferase family protein [Spirochaetaceae bacterium]|jgi:aminoglycoside phosphotransferase (APT) family kinase protein|nr:aminoglycoside phosphotransferase family protein [Spirochaetaceae bacterium]